MHSPVDKGQEHNIKDIKVTYRSEGPNIKWAFLKKPHPAIPVIRALTLHIEEEFGTLTRGKKHTTPKKKLDVQKLQESYRLSDYHKYHRGREINSKKDRAADYTTNGCLKLQRGKLLRKWVELRTFERATRENWDDMLDDKDSENKDVENSGQ
jgi:hypothetical protein